MDGCARLGTAHSAGDIPHGGQQQASGGAAAADANDDPPWPSSTQLAEAASWWVARQQQCLAARVAAARQAEAEAAADKARLGSEWRRWTEAVRRQRVRREQAACSAGFVDSAWATVAGRIARRVNGRAKVAAVAALRRMAHAWATTVAHEVGKLELLFAESADRRARRRCAIVRLRRWCADRAAAREAAAARESAAIAEEARALRASRAARSAARKLAADAVGKASAVTADSLAPAIADRAPSGNFPFPGGASADKRGL